MNRLHVQISVLTAVRMFNENTFIYLCSTSVHNLLSKQGVTEVTASLSCSEIFGEALAGGGTYTASLTYPQRKS